MEKLIHCETDWRVTNLLASRFWPRQGFRLTASRAESMSGPPGRIDAMNTAPYRAKAACKA